MTVQAPDAGWSYWGKHPSFQRMLAGTVLALAGIGVCMPAFFRFVEQREGISLHDPVLEMLPAMDLSAPIFLLIYGPMAYVLLRGSRDPRILLGYLFVYALMSVLRVLTMLLLPLEAPEAFMPMRDPFSSFFYGGLPITKDLFFSGHTATVFMAALILPGRMERRVVLVCSIVLGFLLLIQHVHYTIDVLGAFVAGWFCIWAWRRMLRVEELRS